MNNKADNTVAIRGGMGLADAVFIVFLVLKLLGKITWSWWWVTAPLWGQIVVALGLVIIVFIVTGIIMLFDVILNR